MNELRLTAKLERFIEIEDSKIRNLKLKNSVTMTTKYEQKLKIIERKKIKNYIGNSKDYRNQKKKRINMRKLYSLQDKAVKIEMAWKYRERRHDK